MGKDLDITFGSNIFQLQKLDGLEGLDPNANTRATEESTPKHSLMSPSSDNLIRACHIIRSKNRMDKVKENLENREKRPCFKVKLVKTK